MPTKGSKRKPSSCPSWEEIEIVPRNGAVGVMPPWLAPTGPPLFPEEGTMARGCTKVAWSSTIASMAGIGASDGGGIAERAATGVVVKDFGVPSPAMACGWWDAARIYGGFGVDGNKVEKERV